MESLQYSVVHFINENTVEGVPSNWITNNACAWPFNPKNARKMNKNINQIKKNLVFFKIRMLCSGISEIFFFIFSL